MSGRGFPLPFVVDPTETICVTINVPADENHQAAFWGAFSELIHWFNWQRDAAHTGAAAAAVWRNEYQRAWDDYIAGNCGNMSCDDIADCIENDPNVQAKLSEYLSRQGLYPSDPTVSQPPLINQNIYQSSTLPDGYICNAEHRMGMARYLVVNIHEMVRQLFEELQAATTTLDLTNRLGDNVEGVSWLISISEFADWLIDTAIIQYEQAYSPAQEDIMACAIFCYLGGCELTLEGLLRTLTELASEQISQPLEINNIQDLVDYVQSLQWATLLDTVVVSVMWWLVLSFLKFGGKVAQLSYGFRSFKDLVVSGADEVSGDYPICVDCKHYIYLGKDGYWALGGILNTPGYSVSFGQSDAGCGFSVDEQYGAPYNSGVNPGAWYSVHSTEICDTPYVWLEVNFNSPVTLDQIQPVFSQIRQTGTKNRQRVEVYKNNGNSPVVWQRVKSIGYDFSYNWQDLGYTPATHIGLTGVTKIRIEHEITEGLAIAAIAAKIIYIANS